MNVTDGDREKAAAAWEEARDLGVVEAFAAALAEEREKARAPFRNLAQELAAVACDHHATVAGDAYADAADRIIAVLEGTYL